MLTFSKHGARRRRLEKQYIGNHLQAPVGVLKWNVDGSLQGKLGMAGIGGILRDSIGDYFCTFEKPVGLKESNETEFLTIIFLLSSSPLRRNGYGASHW